MGDTDAGTSVRRVVTRIPFGDIAGFPGKQWRACIAITELDAAHVVHAAMIDTRRGCDLSAQRGARRSVVANMRLDEPAPYRYARRGPPGCVAIAHADRTSLPFVPIE